MSARTSKDDAKHAGQGEAEKSSHRSGTDEVAEASSRHSNEKKDLSLEAKKHTDLDDNSGAPPSDEEENQRNEAAGGDEERSAAGGPDDEEDEDGDDLPSATGAASMGKSPGDVSAGRWTAREHEIFLRGLREHGREWKKIAQMIKSRTVVQIRTHAQKYFQKMARDGVDGAELGQKGGSTTPSRALDSEGKSKKRSHDGSSSARGYSKSPASGVPLGSGVNGGGGGSMGFESKRLHISKPAHGSGSEAMWSPSGVTPRTVAAATILVAPRAGPDSAWFARRQAMALELLGEPRRQSPRLAAISSHPPTWNGAAALNRAAAPQIPSPVHTPPPLSHQTL